MKPQASQKTSSRSPRNAVRAPSGVRCSALTCTGTPGISTNGASTWRAQTGQLSATPASLRRLVDEHAVARRLVVVAGDQLVGQLGGVRAAAEVAQRRARAL